MYNLLLGLIGIIPVLAIALGLVYFWLAFHKEKERIAATRAERLRRSTTFIYDKNGNPEFIYNPATNTLIIPPTGNSPYSPTILIRDSLQRNVRADKERPLLINVNGGNSPTNQGIEGEVLEADEISGEISDEAKLPISEGEKRLYIENCLEKGIGKTVAARAIGIKPGDNKSYNDFSTLWSQVTTI